MRKLEKIINSAWEKKEKINPSSQRSIIKAINETIDLLDQGKIRVAEKESERRSKKEGGRRQRERSRSKKEGGRSTKNL